MCVCVRAGITEASVQARRDEILSTKDADLLAFADAADHVARYGKSVVVASEVGSNV